ADSSGIDESTMPAAGFRAALARDVVPARARPAEGPYWWSELPACALSSSPRGQPSTRAARIVYDLADPVAGALAQRLVALASDSLASDAALLEAVAPALRLAPSPPVSLGLPSGRFVESLRAGNELAFIVALPVRPPDPCRALNVAGVSLSGGGTPVLLSPLVEAGGWAVVRRGRITLEVDWDGSIHIVGAGATPDGGRK
ncbi:MAG TPA: hypothetical protein VMM77_02880, partial [Gemmatimonadaceae bacterium]|nr:hypothetical protein [Gemmatimonadaceae bacterium]